MNDAEMIKLIRSKYELTQKNLATMLNVSLTAVKSWEGSTRSPNGSARRLMQLMLRKPDVINYLAEVEEETLMINLNVNKEKLEIMGVPFSSKADFDATVSSIANSMYEGYQPTMEDVQLFANHQMPETAEGILKLLRAREGERAVG